MDNIIIQYGILALAILFAIYLIFKSIKKNFSSKKFDPKDKNCGPNCGCS